MRKTSTADATTGRHLPWHLCSFSDTRKAQWTVPYNLVVQDASGATIFGDEMHSRIDVCQLIDELSAFRDHDRGADSSQQIYQPVRCAHRFG